MHGQTFLGINLFNYLKQHGIWAVGAIRSNRLYVADKLMKNKKGLQKKGRVSLHYLADVDSNITMVCWIDKGKVQSIHFFFYWP